MASPFRRSYTDKKTGKRKKTKLWYGKFVDGNGVWQRVPLSVNKVAAQQMLNEFVRRAEMEKAGVRDPYQDHRGRPLAEHLADWRQVLAARGNEDSYVRMKTSRARKVIGAAGFAFIQDLSASKVEAALADMRKQPRFGTQTSNHHLDAIKAFARWLVRDRRTGENPLAFLEGGNVRLDRRHVRRDLSDEELVRLFEYVRTAGPVRRLPGPDREMLYLAGVYTGLRASELASLTPASFDLGGRPTVTVEAGYSKHRREDVIPLHADLVRRLGPWLAQKRPRERVWPGKWATNKQAGQMLKRDLERARAAWIAEAGSAAERDRRGQSDFLAYADRDGEVADFHALRHTFITRLVKAGVKPKDAQALARHSTITLTMDRYAHVGLHDVTAALDSLPAIPSSDPQRESLLMTGTDGSATGPPTGPKLAQASDRGGLRLMTGEEPEAPGRHPGGGRQTLDLMGLEEDRGLLTSGEGGIRSYPQRVGVASPSHRSHVKTAGKSAG